ncbi:MAG: hypothetical protein GY760_00465 [Deltaproteobacteria bacterium]|nr:hypothetical protein [Deltaproteobacteria bacterium]
MEDVQIKFIFQLDSKDIEKELKDVTIQEIIEEAFKHEGNKSCCAFKGGFEIKKSGKIWNSLDGWLLYDDLYMAFNIIKSLIHILNGEKKSDFFFYEESQASMFLKGENITLIDKAFGKIIFEATDFKLSAFAKEILKEGEKLNSFIKKLIIELDRYDDNLRAKDMIDHLKSINSHEIIYELNTLMKKWK